MRLFALTLAAFATLPAYASSPAAQADFDKTVAEACSIASGFNEARTSAIIGFDDTLGKVAVLVTGVYPQAFMKGATGTMLCIYDKASGQAWTDEAAGWTAETPAE